MAVLSRHQCQGRGNKRSQFYVARRQSCAREPCSRRQMQFLLRQSKCALPAVKCNQTLASSPSEKVQKIPTPVFEDQASEPTWAPLPPSPGEVPPPPEMSLTCRRRSVSFADAPEIKEIPQIGEISFHLWKEDQEKLKKERQLQKSVTVQVLDGLEVLLTRWVNSAAAMNSQESLEFCSPRVFKISIRRYLSRIYDWFSCSDQCYVMALVYILRIVKMNSSVEVCNRSVHRLLFFATMLAAKYHDDAIYANSFYAKVGGLTLEEVNTLELQFLSMLDWKTFVDGEEYQIFYDFVCEAAGVKAAKAEAQLTPPKVPGDLSACPRWAALRQRILARSTAANPDRQSR